MAPINIQAALKKYKDNASAAGPAYTAGVEAVTTAPTALAAAAASKWIANVQAAYTEGRFQAGCNAVDLSAWKAATTSKGASNYRTGIANLSPRAVKAMQDQLAKAEQIRQQIATMPNNSEADADARMLAAVRMMRETKKR